MIEDISQEDKSKSIELKALEMACGIFHFDSVLKDLFEKTQSNEICLVRSAYQLNFPDMFDADYRKKEREGNGIE